MFLEGSLEQILGKETNIRLLRALVHLPEGFATSGRDIALRAGVDHKFAAKILNELTDMGILKVNRTRSAHYFQLNFQHALFEPIRALFLKEAALPQEFQKELVKALKKHRIPAQSAILFGSVVHGEDDENSDVDVALIFDPKTKNDVEVELDKVGEDLKNLFGRRLHFSLGRKPLQSLLNSEDTNLGFWHQVTSRGKVLI